MKRFALQLSYCGTAYKGWQFQPSQPTVQAELEKALSLIADEPIKVHCAGRTDAGVHAVGQVVHFDTAADREADAFLLGGNANLPRDISISFAKKVSNDFHARFSALSRSYTYLIYNQPIRSPFALGEMTFIPYVLDVERMNDAAQYLLGEHDFSSFRAAECQSSTPMRCVTEIAIKSVGSIIRIDISANAFLHHMVRNIVGVLLEVGQCREEPTWVKEVLEAKDRTKAAITAPADGLYLRQVVYSDKYEIPSPSLWPLNS